MFCLLEQPFIDLPARVTDGLNNCQNYAVCAEPELAVNHVVLLRKFGLLLPQFLNHHQSTPSIFAWASLNTVSQVSFLGHFSFSRYQQSSNRHFVSVLLPNGLVAHCHRSSWSHFVYFRYRSTLLFAHYTADSKCSSPVSPISCWLSRMVSLGRHLPFGPRARS